MTSTKMSISPTRQPIVLIIDASESMRKAGKIELVNELLHKFKEKILQDWDAQLKSEFLQNCISVDSEFIQNKDAQKGIEISIVTFGPNAKFLSKFVPVSEFNPPTLFAQGDFPMGAGLLQAFKLIDKREKKYRDNLVEYYYNPVIILIAGSKPTDMKPEDSKWKEVMNRIQNSYSSFYIMAIEPTNKEILNLISSSNRMPRRYCRLSCSVNKDSLNRILEKVVRKELVRLDSDLAFTQKEEEGPEILECKPNWNIDNVEQNSEAKQVKSTFLKELPHIFGASVIGPLHIQKEIVCQDACAYESLASGYGVIAVADGLGSASKSDIGAETAVEAALHAAKTIITNKNISEIDLDYIAREAVASARKELEVKAIEEGCDLRDLACTLIVVIICKDSISAAHIGDGAVVAKKDGNLLLFSSPGESEYVNEVVPLTSKEWEKSLRIARKVSNVESVAVFTDGCQRAALCNTQSGAQPYERFFEPLFSYAKKLDDLNKGGQDIRDLLVSQKMSENSEDDKTFVISVLKNGSGNGDKSYSI